MTIPIYARIYLEIGLHHTTAISRRKPCPEKAGPGRQPSLHSQLPQHSHRSSRPAPRSPWPPTGRGCSRIFQYENLPSTTNAYFVPPLFSTGGHNPREDLRPHGHTTNSDLEPRAAPQPGLCPARGGAPLKLPPGRVVCDCHRTRSPGWRCERKHFSLLAHLLRGGQELVAGYLELYIPIITTTSQGH